MRMSRQGPGGTSRISLPGLHQLARTKFALSQHTGRPTCVEPNSGFSPAELRNVPSALLATDLAQAVPFHRPGKLGPEVIACYYAILWLLLVITWHRPRLAKPTISLPAFLPMVIKLTCLSVKILCYKHPLLNHCHIYYYYVRNRK